MIEELIGALAGKLDEGFKHEYKVYTEGVYQFAEKPCFFIECESVEKMPLLGNRFYMRVWVKVTMENEGEEKKHEAQKVLGDIFSLMNWVGINSLNIEGRRIHGKWENGALVIRGCYDIFIGEKEAEEKDLMEIIEGGYSIDDGGEQIYKG